MMYICTYSQLYILSKFSLFVCYSYNVSNHYKLVTGTVVIKLEIFIKNTMKLEY